MRKHTVDSFHDRQRRLGHSSGLKLTAASVLLTAGLPLAGQTTPAPVTVSAPAQTAPAQTAPAQTAPARTAPAKGAPAAPGQAEFSTQAPAAASTTSEGGTIHGTVKIGPVPLPGVAITATNTLTGKKYATTTDIDGNFAMTIPHTGRYVVRAELAAFAPATSEVRITAEAANQTAAFTLELSSRAAAASQTANARAAGGVAAALGRGTQSLDVSGLGEQIESSAGGAANGASLPSLGALGDSNGSESVAVNGIQGTTNGLGALSEDEVRDRIQSALDDARRQGGGAGDQVDAVVSLLGGVMGGGGFGPGGGGGGRGGPGGGGGRGGGGGAFRNFNPTQPHGAIFYQGGFSQLDAQAFSLTGIETPKPNSYQNRFGVSFTGSPYIPGLTKPSTKQFIFFNLTGVRNITPENFYGTVPTLLERGQIQNADGTLSNTDANLAGLVQIVNGVPVNSAVYNPATLTQFPNNVIPNAQITPQARFLENYYPLPNVPNVTTRNYQETTTRGTDNTNASARFVRNFGAAPARGGFGRGGGGGGGGGGQRRNAPPTLRQSINVNFAFSHAASDLRNIIPVLGGKQASQGYSLTTGYTVGYGRLNNNASLSWNRSHATTLNYFTGLPIDPSISAGVSVPSESAGLARPGFYNGVPNIGITNFTSLTETQPRDAINQTISFSDFLAYRHGKHNMRFGGDIRRVHADQVGGNNVTGTFSFTGLVTESASDRALTQSNATSSTQEPTTGSALADFLLGQPQQTKIQAGLYKTYLRENVFDWYANDDYRVSANVTLNFGLRYEFFGPYSEKNNRLVNLDHNADFTVVDPVQPNGVGEFEGKFPNSLVNPDHDLYSPRFSVAWHPKLLKQTVVRASYGINYNTGAFATFAQSLAFQPPFAITQNNVLATSENSTGCVIESPGVASNMTLANGFGCSVKAIQNTYSVDKNYRLGHVQVWNLDIQRSLPRGVVVNVGYNGSKGGNLDIVTAPNVTATTVTTPNAQAFTYETSVAESRLQQLVVSARKRLEKGISLQVLYQYGHSIDNASSIGGSAVSQVQNSRALNLEEGNSSFDIRQQVSGNFLFELPFGPNRAFFNRGGITSHILDGFGVSGMFNFASGTYYTPQYTGSAAQIAAGGTYTLRPDRVFTQPIAGPGTRDSWFNKAAFVAPANGFGTASRNSIEGPGTVSINMALSRSFSFGSTRSLETRMTATNVFNTVQYSGIDTTINSASFGQVTATAQQRQISLLGRYRF